MRKTIKSLICAASAAVICAAPIAPTFAGLSPVTGITAEAADFVTKNGNLVTFDTSKIYVTSYDLSKNASVSMQLGDKKNFSRNGIEPFERQSVEFDITSNLSDTLIKDNLKKIRIKVKSWIDGKDYFGTTYYKIDYTKTNTTATGMKTYHCSCDFYAYGVKYEANIVDYNENDPDNSPATKCTVKKLMLSCESGDNYKVEAKTPNGNNIYAVFPKKVNNTITDTIKLKVWAKDLCVLANSLSEMTGSSKDTIYIIPIENLANFAETANGAWWDSNEDTSKYSLIKLTTLDYSKREKKESAVEKEASLIKYNVINDKERENGKGRMNQYMIHEMGHAYRDFKGDDWNPKYQFGLLPSIDYIVGDDIFADSRSLTAMRYCTNLNKYTLRKQINKSGGCVYVKYDEVYCGATLSPLGSKDYVYYFEQALVNNIGLENLRDFYSGSTNCLPWKSSQTVKFANKLSEELHFMNNHMIGQITVTNSAQYKHYLMFVNCLVGAYGYTQATTAEQKEFINRINEDFKVAGYKNGKDFIYYMATDYLGNNLSKDRS